MKSIYTFALLALNLTLLASQGFIEETAKKVECTSHPDEENNIELNVELDKGLQSERAFLQNVAINEKPLPIYEHSGFIHRDDQPGHFKLIMRKHSSVGASATLLTVKGSESYLVQSADLKEGQIAAFLKVRGFQGFRGLYRLVCEFSE